MQNLKALYAPVVVGVGLAAGAITPATAAPTLNSEVKVTAFTPLTPPSGVDLANTYVLYEGYNTPSANLDYSTSFTGVNSQFEGLLTMGIHAVGAAAAAPGALKASNSLTISNAFENQAPHSDPDDVFFGIAPNSIYVQAKAMLFDNLSVSSAAPISALQVSVTMDGTTSYSSGLNTTLGAPVYTDATMRALDSMTGMWGHICSSCGGGMVQGPGTFNPTYTLTLPVSDQNAVAFGLRFSTISWFEFMRDKDYSLGETYTIDMDFSHTVNITGFQGLDSNGSIVALNSVTGSDGFAYPLAAVPEAETWAMMLAGLGLVGWTARRRRQVH